MAPFVRNTLLAVFVAITGSSWIAAAAHAETAPDDLLRGGELVEERQLVEEQGFHTTWLPQLREENPHETVRGYHKRTLLQFDRELGARSDVAIRVQARNRKILYIEFRF